MLVFSLCTFLNAQEINLNGEWDFGVNRAYSKKVEVPGIVLDPAKLSPNKVWYKKEIELPLGEWEQASLELRGARFSPKVYINGDLVSEKNGGMAKTSHFLRHKAIKPGATVFNRNSLNIS